MVKRIGVCVEATYAEEFTFGFVMYGKTDPYKTGTHVTQKITSNGVEVTIDIDEINWSSDDAEIGQMFFEFPQKLSYAKTSIILYVRDGFALPPLEQDEPLDTTTDAYKNMIASSLVQAGDCTRIKQALIDAKNGKQITIAYIGGSITQGAGAVPASKKCYAYQSFCGFARETGVDEKNLRFVRAGIGGTPSELGVLRYEKDVCNLGEVQPDIVVVEFAVNDEGDETKGECYEGLVRKILQSPNNPAVVLLFAVFSDDFNLQERLMPVGKNYNLAMLSIKNAVTKQFYLAKNDGRIVSKGQFFYDVFHPSNCGHTIMAECLNYFWHFANTQIDKPCTPCANKKNAILPKAVYSDIYESVKLYEKNHSEGLKNLDVGDFVHTDKDLQLVERNYDSVPTPQFVDNWMYNAGKNRPMTFTFTGRVLMLIIKDSANQNFGVADVFVDDKKMRSIDPKLVGWTHCNAVRIWQDESCAQNGTPQNACAQAGAQNGAHAKEHHVKICMQNADEQKQFTILGIGIVHQFLEKI